MCPYFCHSMISIYKFFKRLSVFKKVMTIGITLLLIGYIFCLPRQLFHVPYSTVVTDRNEELLGARIASDGQWRFPHARQHRRRSNNVSLRSRINISIIIGVSTHYPSEEPSTRTPGTNVLWSGGSTLTMQTIRLALKRIKNFRRESNRNDLGYPAGIPGF